MKSGTAAGPRGWGFEHALDARGAYETTYVNCCKLVSSRFKGFS